VIRESGIIQGIILSGKYIKEKLRNLVKNSGIFQIILNLNLLKINLIY